MTEKMYTYNIKLYTEERKVQKLIKKFGIETKDGKFDVDIRQDSLDEVKEMLTWVNPFFEKIEFSDSFLGWWIDYKKKHIGGAYCSKNPIGFKALYEKQTGNKDTDDDPLPPHEPDGYWSGEHGYSPASNNPAEYQEGVDSIIEMQDQSAEYPIRICNRKYDEFRINDRQDMECYIKDFTKGLITQQGDNYIKWFPTQYISSSDDLDSATGIFAVRCGDCGKIAQGKYKGNPDMGDWMYETYHRKNYFCEKYGWTYMGGHGYPGGRRMICPDCSKEYASGNRRI